MQRRRVGERFSSLKNVKQMMGHVFVLAEHGDGLVDDCFCVERGAEERTGWRMLALLLTQYMCLTKTLVIEHTGRNGRRSSCDRFFVIVILELGWIWWIRAGLLKCDRPLSASLAGY